uniref:hypothetical protein n=1 Tax=uncultured Altererythrobacter sp. TaxID=500840 RepID=UPI0026114A38|nr:hypothetical protein [uncultured Altererythrobacter sp.]
MSILKSDISRNFGIGFVLGALMVGAMSVQTWDTQVASPAMAATADVETSTTR